MDQHTVLIADSSEDFCDQLQDILRWVCHVRSAQKGSKALKLLRDQPPDILVLDLMLPELDGISILKALSASGRRPIVLATTCLVTDYILQAAQQLNVDYLLVKPCDIHATAARIQEQLHRLEPPAPDDSDLKFRISGLLFMMGISPKLQGFRFLREAIAQVLLKPGQSVTKELYPAVARCCGTEGSHVERSIRGAIQDGWERRDPRIWQLYFPPDGRGLRQRPTNAVFINRIADGLRISRGLSAPPLHFVPSPDSGDLPRSGVL